MKKNIIITILLIIVLVLGGYLAFDKLINKNETQENVEDTKNEYNKTSYTYSNIAGKYTYTSDVLDVLEGSNLIGRGILSLYENGTFIYHITLMADGGYIGNYTIIDNKVVLNYLFEITNGAGVNVVEGGKTLTINSDGTLIDPNIKFGSFNLNDIKLERSNEQLDDEFEKIINNYNITNSANK